MATTPASVRRARVRAPELRGRRWLGTGGTEPSLASLRGGVVLLHFWTSGCVNCLHVLEELRPLQERFAGALVTVGVHSPKFRHEADPAALDAAVQRLAVHHPVLDDPDLVTWRAYAVRAWPTLVLVDPEGYVAAQVSGEGHAATLETLVAELLAAHGAVQAPAGLGGDRGVPAAPPASVLHFPARALALPAGGYLVADTAQHRLVELGGDLATPLRRIGSGRPGLSDGDPGTAAFSRPRGLALLPAAVAERAGYDLVVADTGNHALRGVRLSDGHVRTVAGTGRRLRRREGGGPALEQDLASPWDVVWFDGQLVVAMAGMHQLWAFDPVPDPVPGGAAAAGVVRVLAGTTAEGLRDGAAEQAWFAQPSGLAVGGDEEELLWFVDAETSALRWLRRSAGTEPDRAVPVVTDDRMANVAPVARPGYEVGTVAGLGLFDFGLRDGPGRAADAVAALLQHPQGLAPGPDGSVLVADAYNGAVRRYDPASGEVTTLLTGLAEPADVLVEEDALVVVEAAAHRVVRFPLPARLRRGPAGGAAEPGGCAGGGVCAQGAAGP